MNSIGIVGYGSFGSLLARLAAPYVTVTVCDAKPITGTLPPGVIAGSITDAARCDAVVIAVDLSGMPGVCKQLAQLVKPTTTVMDICSVKVVPAQIMLEQLGGKCRLLATHPMFGPNSVAMNSGSCKGLAMVWHELTGGPFPELEQFFGSTLGANITRMTPDEHDRQMAWVHALTFFVGRGLLELNIPEMQLDTGYYQKLRDLCELERTHSRALFDTIEAGNPYSAEVRQKFLTTLNRLNTEIQETAL